MEGSTPTVSIETQPLDARSFARLEALKIASAQHQRTNAVPADLLVSYATKLSDFVLNGGATTPKDEDPLS